MEIKRYEDRSIVLESFNLEREAADKQVRVRAQLLLTNPGITPHEMRIQVEYQSNDIPDGNEAALGGRLLTLLKSHL